MRVKPGIELCREGKVLLWRSIDQGCLRVGSDPACDVCIPLAGVAPTQMLLRLESGGLYLTNQATEGTRVGVEVVDRELRLADGDSIALGDIVARVRFGGAAAVERENTRALTEEVAETALVLIFPQALPGKFWQLDLRGVRVGSDANNDVVLQDPFVSAFHASIHVERGRCMVRDLGSRNGTFVDGRKTAEAEIKAGARVRFGETIATVVEEDAGVRDGPAGCAASRLVGESAAMQAVRELVQRVARHDAPVLITGETGSGKEVVARMVAEMSGRASGPFMALNCGSLGQNLIESELFGHEKGAFTGAMRRKAGAFEAANGGTLFLDEIGELPLSLQPQLLRVLESGEVRRLGGTETLHVDVRLVSATNRDLSREVSAGTFRADLLHRLYVLVLDLPPLRQRREDISALVEHFLAAFSPPGEVIQIAAAAAAKLRAYSWPGNVRELRNVLQRAALLRSGSRIEADDITFCPAISSRAGGTARRGTLQQIERDAIVAELMRHSGNKTDAAYALGVSRSTIHRKIEEYSIDITAFAAHER